MIPPPRNSSASPPSSSSSSTTAVHLLAAVALTIIVFSALTILLLLLVLHRQRSRRAQNERTSSTPGSTHQPLPSVKDAMQQTLAVRLFFAGMATMVILLLQQMWGSPSRRNNPEDADSTSAHAQSLSYDMRIMLLYMCGILAALLVIALNHVLYWNYCRRTLWSSPPCDDTVAESVEDEVDESADDIKVEMVEEGESVDWKTMEHPGVNDLETPAPLDD